MLIIKMSTKFPDEGKSDTTWQAKAVEIQGSRLLIQALAGFLVEYNLSFVTWLDITWVE